MTADSFQGKFVSIGENEEEETSSPPDAPRSVVRQFPLEQVEKIYQATGGAVDDDQYLHLSLQLCLGRLSKNLCGGGEGVETPIQKQKKAEEAESIRRSQQTTNIVGLLRPLTQARSTHIEHRMKVRPRQSIEGKTNR